jgi:hypothetical protein
MVCRRPVWEFAGRVQISRERGKLADGLSSTLGGFRDALKVPEQQKDEALSKLTNDVLKAFNFEYDAMAKTKGGDGSSETGHFVLMRGDERIENSDKFREQLLAALMDALKIDVPTSELGQQVSDTLGVEMTRLVRGARRTGAYKPWDLPAGSRDGATRALFGDDKAEKELSKQDLSAKPGERTRTILADFVTSCGDEEGMVGLGVSSKHAFNGLPNHPSLKALKGDGDSDTDVGKRIDENLVKKGRTISETELSAERAGWLFDQEIAKVRAESDNEMGELLNRIAAEKRPATKMKPAALVTAVTDALQPYYDQLQRKNAKVAKPSANRLKNELIRDMGAPVFVMADTNWGDPKHQKFFAVAPDPVTGEPVMWLQCDPPGTLSPLPEEWLEEGWVSFGGAGS